jgi:hypothetical protein
MAGPIIFTTNSPFYVLVKLYNIEILANLASSGLICFTTLASFGAEIFYLAHNYFRVSEGESKRTGNVFRQKRKVPFNKEQNGFMP